METISFIIPCYMSEKIICSVVDEIKKNISYLNEYNYEIILVNDNSRDNVWNVIVDLCKIDSNIVGINLSKNFGQPSAVMAGLSKSNGNYIVTLDDDGQSPIDALKDIIEKLKSGNYDVVYGLCKDAKFGLFRRLGSKLNGLMANSMFNRPKDCRIISFCIMKRYIVNEILKYTHPYTYMSGLVYRTTSNIGYLNVEHRVRKIGKSGYSLKKLINVWMNGFTSFSIKPLRIIAFIGFIFSFLGFIFGLLTIINKIISPNIITGSIPMISISLFISGINFIFLGLLGEYVGRIYMSINYTPQYIIKECINGRKKYGYKNFKKNT